MKLSAKMRVCCDCRKGRNLTKHHVTKDGQRTGVSLLVCRDCHDIREITEGVRQPRRKHRFRFLNRLTSQQRERLRDGLSKQERRKLEAGWFPRFKMEMFR